MLQVRQAIDLCFDRDRDLLLHLFRSTPWPLRNHLHVIVRDVRIGLNRQIAEERSQLRTSEALVASLRSAPAE